jgi:hypothetical protein
MKGKRCPHNVFGAYHGSRSLLLGWTSPLSKRLVKESHHEDIETSPVARYPRSKPICATRPVFRARSTSHAVAAHSSCTKIPLSADRAQEDENHSRMRHFRPWLATVRLPGSARTDQVLGDDGVPLVYLLGLHRNAFDNDAGGHVFPERDQ